MMKKIARYGNYFRFYSTTIDQQEMKHFQKWAGGWWEEFGEFKPLHSMNKLRVPWIRDSLINQNGIKNSAAPLAGYSILDAGCGGGILTEPLARIGADVTGLDANSDQISSAKLHADLHNLKINYVVSSIEQHAQEACEKYDAVVASEVIEHVTQKGAFLEACIKCLKPNGIIFITTLNKTWQSNLFGIIIAENVIREIPKGTHQVEKFIAPHELQRLLEDCNCKTEMIQGTFYNFLTNNWHLCSDSSMTFMLKAIKLPKE